jgi:hypothetical protein
MWISLFAIVIALAICISVTAVMMPSNQRERIPTRSPFPSNHRRWALSKLTAEQKCASTIAEKKLQRTVAHVIGVNLRHIRSNPMNIIKDAQTHSTRAMMISFGSNSSGSVSCSSAYNPPGFPAAQLRGSSFEIRQSGEGNSP